MSAALRQHRCSNLHPSTPAAAAVPAAIAAVDMIGQQLTGSSKYNSSSSCGDTRRYGSSSSSSTASSSLGGTSAGVQHAP
jgi:hypothetical protein